MTTEDKAHGQEETQAALQQERRQRSEERDAAVHIAIGLSKARKKGKRVPRKKR
jgi:Family of unknown function (DUF6496)